MRPARRCHLPSPYYNTFRYHNKVVPNYFHTSCNYLCSLWSAQLISTLMEREISTAPSRLKVCIEAIFAIIGVCVAVLGITLNLAWPSCTRWLCRAPRQNPRPCVLQRVGRRSSQTLTDTEKTSILTPPRTALVLWHHCHLRLTTHDKESKLANRYSKCFSMDDSQRGKQRLKGLFWAETYIIACPTEGRRVLLR